MPKRAVQPGSPVAVQAQMWSDAMRFSDIQFWTHGMAREASNSVMGRTAETNDAKQFFFSMTESMISAKAAKVFCENGWGLSIVTACYDDGRFAYLHGDPRKPDYETMVLRPESSTNKDTDSDDVTYDMPLFGVENQIRTLSALPFSDPVDFASYSYSIFALPDVIHNPSLHGSFLYGDAHNLNSLLWANRICLDPVRWQTIQRESRANGVDAGRNSGLISVNRWCAEHCIGGYAWTGSSPTWVFESHNDAVAFKIRWG